MPYLRQSHPLTQIEGQQPREQEHDGVERRVHGVQLHALELLLKEVKQLWAAMEELQQVEGRLDSDCSVSQHSKQHQG
jgi:hypothetical protein